jgi:hypothetical protein
VKSLKLKRTAVRVVERFSGILIAKRELALFAQERVYYSV